eukprot:TRINITY_DN13903_c0_g2_i2.p1 TRINITY_DN13903_c0_g2~~TRINITY_DN13903_c0_g2_i2.p1  ORF type:complete len:702 (-),score=169.12 TRINITY_DN13903_c0_g2_i2:97-2202(-)
MMGSPFLQLNPTKQVQYLTTVSEKEFEGYLKLFVEGKVTTEWQEAIGMSDFVNTVVEHAQVCPTYYTKLMRIWARLENFEFILSRGALSCLAPILASNIDQIDLVEDGCKAIGMIATIGSSRSELASQGSVQILTTVMDHHKSNSRLVSIACAALSNTLYQSDTNKLAFIDSDGFNKLEYVFHNFQNSEKPLYYASLVLRNLCNSGNVTKKKLLKKTGGLIGFLKKAIEQTPKSYIKSQVNLVWSLSNLISTEKSLKELFGNLGGMAIIAKLIEHNSFEAELQKACAFALFRLWTEEENVMFSIPERITEKLFSTMEEFSDHLGVLRNILKALFIFFTSETASNFLLSFGQIQIIIRTVDDNLQDPYIVSNGVRLLCAIQQGFMAEFEASNPKDLLQKILTRYTGGVAQSAEQCLSMLVQGKLSMSLLGNKSCDDDDEDDENDDLEDEDEDEGGYDDTQVEELKRQLLGVSTSPTSQEEALILERSRLSSQLKAIADEIDTYDTRIEKTRGQNNLLENSIQVLNKRQTTQTRQLQDMEQKIKITNQKIEELRAESKELESAITKMQDSTVILEQESKQNLKQIEIVDNSNKDLSNLVLHHLVLSLKFVWSDVDFMEIRKIQEEVVKRKVHYSLWGEYFQHELRSLETKNKKNDNFGLGDSGTRPLGGAGAGGLAGSGSGRYQLSQQQQQSKEKKIVTKGKK